MTAAVAEPRVSRSDLVVGSGLRLPLDWMTLATVVYGARGAGKTVFGAVLAEEVTKHHQRFCAIDIKEDWWGLKSSADGKEEGIPVVIFGGPHADLPLEEGAGAQIAELVAGLETSTILSLEHLSKGKQIKFLTAFFERLYDVNRDPLLVLADEAQRYAPQKPMSTDATICLGVVEDLVKLGRKHGIGLVLITQRGAGLNKEVSELCDVMAAFRTPGPLDQDRIKDWLDANATREQRDEIIGTPATSTRPARPGKLSSLPTGTAVVASSHPSMPLFVTSAIRMRWTFDSSATPRIGQKRAEPKRMSKPDLEQLRERMATAIERAKADDPRELRKRIAALETALRDKATAVESVDRIIATIVEVPALSPEDRADIGRLGGTILEAAGIHERINSRLEKLAERLFIALTPPASSPAASTSPAPSPSSRAKSVRTAPAPSLPPATPPPTVSSTSMPSASLNGPQQTVLNAVAWWQAAGIDDPTHVQVGYIAGYTASGGYWRSIVGALSTAGLIAYPRAGRITLTGVGAAAAQPPETPPTRAALQEMVRAKLSGPQRNVLDELLAINGEQLSAEELGLRTGYTPSGGYWRSIVGKLSTLGLIVYPKRGQIAAAPVLFAIP